MNALKKIRVIDLSQIMAGPYCSMMLADMGADVIKVEPPEKGESTRSAGPPFVNGESGAFLAVNRNKKSVTINLKTDKGREVFYRLVETADVLVENYRPDVVKRLGIDYETLKEINPSLVYCSISGFGQTGPYSKRGGLDLIAQGMSGIMSVTGHKDGDPVKSGLPITDLGAGMFAVYGILSALFSREDTGKGQYVDTSLFEAGLSLSVWESVQYWYSNQIPEPTGSGHRQSAPYQAFKASDGHFTVGADLQHLWKKFCEVIGNPDLAYDDRFYDNGLRMEHLQEMIDEIEELTVQQPRDYWLEKLYEAGIPAGPIYSYDEALNDPHTKARNMVETVNHPTAGELKTLGIPVKLSETPAKIKTAAPSLGQHIDDVLQELKYSKEEIDELRSEKIV